MELLAPAGERAALEAAVRAGADAVYLGLGALNARRGAGNFEGDAFLSAVDYCHERGVKAYVTVNTLVRDDEMPLLEKAARQLARAGADAALVQDLGVAAALKQMLPSLPLHASTQMAVCNYQGVKWLRDNGFTRAVLARETAYAEIAQCAAQGLEIECFAHGALCTACSGLCLFSSLVGGRSGNRGLCAQPCRLPYRLVGGDVNASGDLLSPKDLCSLSHIKDLERAGATSLKLEGRLKSADYVYGVTRVYRAALDGEKVDARLLTYLFNRGYTAGYGPGVNDAELMSVNEEHVDKGAFSLPEPPERRVPLTGVLTVRPGEIARLTVSDGINTAEATGETVARAVKNPADEARLIGQIEKTGGTPYRFANLSADVAPDAFIPVSVLNALRRDALSALGEMRVHRARGCAAEITPLMPVDFPGSPAPEKPLLCVESGDPKALRRALQSGADEIILRADDVTNIALPPDKCALAVPPALSGDDLSALNAWASAHADSLTGVLISNVAHLALSWPGQTRLDAPMNVMNARAINFLGLPYAPSVELTGAQIRALPCPGARELIVYGRLTLMYMKHCPLSAAKGGGKHAACRRCAGDGLSLRDMTLIDRKGVRFPLARTATQNGCIVKILNSQPLMLLRKFDRLPPAGRLRLIFTDEDEQAQKNIIGLYRMAIDGRDFRDTPEWAQWNEKPATTGHYFRGVE